MSETKHTPGPWNWTRNELCFADFEQGELINPDVTEPVVTVATAQSGWWLEVRPANARLIAAAPELLAACKHIWKFLDDRYDVDEESGTGHKREYPYSGAGEHMQLLDRVIAKAEGRNG